MKKWYKSKTLWINVLAIAGMIAEYCLTQKIYSPETHALVLAVINLLLRLMTNQGVSK